MPVKTNNTDYQKLDILFKYSRESVLIFNDDINNLKILAFNKKAHQQLGYTREEFKKISLKDIEAVESPKETLEHLKKIYTEGNAIFETRHKKKNGELIDILVIAQVFVLDNKKVFQVIFKDITKQKQAEKAIKEEEEKYKNIFEYSGDASFIIDFDPKTLTTRFEGLNKNAMKLFGVSSSDIIGRIDPSIFSPKVQPDGQDSMVKGAELTKLALAGKPQRFEWEHINIKTKKSFFVDVSLSAIKIKGRMMALGVLKDITKQKQSEKELKRQEKKYRDLFETASDMIHVVDNKGAITDANELELKTMGYTRKEYIGKKNFDILSKKYKKSTGEQIKKVLSGTCVKHIRTQFIKKNGDFIDVEINACPTIENEKIIGATAFIRDISKRIEDEKQLEEKIQELEKLNKIMVGRELRMVELKKEIKKLKEPEIFSKTKNNSKL
jgi:PAS domain S-box-containing protein